MFELEEASHMSTLRKQISQGGRLSQHPLYWVVAELCDKGLLEVDYFFLKISKVDFAF